ncbi:MAG: ribonuclease HI family protein [Gemmataceae bacterium]|nr:ribonuclease HI family protein [Gemmataceae bacterium]
MNDTWTIYTDGGSRGNPGPAAYAYVIKRLGQPDIEEMAYLGETTNNIAEYTGLVKALEHAREIGGKNLLVKSDSELMVKQLNGLYRVKNEGLRPLYQQAVALRRHFESVTIKHICRDENSQADALCNEAMDNPHDSKPRIFVRQDSNPVLPKKTTGLKSSPTKATPLMQALALMKEGAAAWAESGDATDPPPAAVLNRIVEILQREDAD